MKKVLFIAPIIILAFVGFEIIQSETLSKPAQTESKQPSATRPRTASATQQEEDSPYVNGKAQLAVTSFDFGYTPIRSSAFHPFHILNVGTDTLDIVKIKPG